jgi:hypothetical protein
MLSFHALPPCEDGVSGANFYSYDWICVKGESAAPREASPAGAVFTPSDRAGSFPSCP